MSVLLTELRKRKRTGLGGTTTKPGSVSRTAFLPVQVDCKEDRQKCLSCFVTALLHHPRGTTLAM
jgi:hypothetical protein